jgi:hypothetical protein
MLAELVEQGTLLYLGCLLDVCDLSNSLFSVADDAKVHPGPFYSLSAINIYRL